MALITRLSRLFQADLNAVIDRIEEPEILLRQAIRDMEADVDRDRQRIAQLELQSAEWTSRRSDYDQSLREIDTELDICFQSDKEDLARALVKRKLETQQMRKFLAQKSEALAQRLDQLKTRLNEHRSRLDAMRQKAEMLCDQDDVDHGDDSFNFPDALTQRAVRNEDVEVAYLRERQKKEPHMNRPTFPEGAAVAFLASVGGGALYSFAAAVLPGSGAQRLIIAALGLGYILYLQGRGPVRAGRLVVFVGWTITAGAIALSDVSPILYVALHVGLIWLIRSLYFYSGIFPALMDLAVSGLSLIIAFWAYTNTQSPALGIWCFFLTQALFVAIPQRLTPKPRQKASSTKLENNFELAHRAAEIALRKLASNNS